jgi:hypothetical protein
MELTSLAGWNPLKRFKESAKGEAFMSTVNRIDVHQHVAPPFWMDGLPTHGDPSGARAGDPSHL